MRSKEWRPRESDGLKMTIHQGTGTGKVSLLCELEGGVVLEHREHLTVCEEALRVLELCAEKYSTPYPTEDSLCVFVWRKDGGNLAPLLNVDIELRREIAKAVLRDFSGHILDCETAFEADDDVVAITRRVLATTLRGER